MSTNNEKYTVGKTTNQVLISKERLKELEYIEKNYSSIIVKCASQIILSQIEQGVSSSQSKKEQEGE
jgi:hypothetical protein